MKTRVTLPSFACVLLLASCGEDRTAAVPTSIKTSTGKQSMQTHTVRDESNGLDALSFSHPAGWRANSTVVWRPLFQDPAAIVFSAASPDGQSGFEVLPTIYQQYYQDPHGRQGMAPPLSLEELAKFIVAGMSQDGKLRGRLLETHETSRNQQQMPPITPGLNGVTEVATGAAALTIEREGRLHDAVLLLSMQSQTFTDRSFLFSTQSIWSFTAFLGYAPPGKREDAATVLLAAVQSIQPKQEFVALYQQTAKRLQQGANNAQQAKSDTIHQTGRRISESSDAIASAYWNRQQSQDRLSQQWSNRMRDVTQVTDPYLGNRHEVSNQFDQHWITPSGDVFSTNAGDGDPNTGGIPARALEFDSE